MWFVVLRLIFWFLIAVCLLTGHGVESCGDDPTQFDVPILGQQKIPTLRLLRIKEPPRPGTKPVLPEYLGFNHIALYSLLTNSHWFCPRDSIIAQLDNTGPADLLDSEWYSPELPSILIFHDICTDVHSAQADIILKGLILRNFHLNYNLFMVDLPNDKCQWFSSVSNSFAKTAGYKTAYELAQSKFNEIVQHGLQRQKIHPDQINIITIGTHIQFALEFVNSLKSKIKSFVGLDPDNDAAIISTEANNIELFQLYHAGPIHDNLKNIKGCVHFRIIMYPKTWYDGKGSSEILRMDCVNTFLGVIMQSHRFKAWKCDTELAFRRNECKGDETGMTYPAIPTREGVYFLRIMPIFPHGVSDDGRKFDQDTLDRNMQDKGEGISYDPTEFSYYRPDEILKNHEKEGWYFGKPD